MMIHIFLIEFTLSIIHYIDWLHLLSWTPYGQCSGYHALAWMVKNDLKIIYTCNKCKHTPPCNHVWKPTCEMTGFFNVILQSVLPACMEIIVLRIAVWPVEILGYVTKSRVIVTEVAWQGGKEICVIMVNMCLKRSVSNSKCIM